MKIKTSLAILLVAALVAACSTSAPAQEAVVEEPAVEDAMTDSGMDSEDAMAAEDAAAMESEDAAMEDTAMEEPGMDESMAAEVSFSADVWPIIEEYALDAHGGKGGVFLESYDDILGYVTPGDPENSKLYKALIGDGAPQMPPDGPLPDEMIQTIYNWIAQGAQDN
jgi:hypothetical protein